MNRFALAALFVGALWLVTKLTGPIERPPGVLVKGDPVQVDYPDGYKPDIIKKGWIIKPLASYRVEARVLEKETYDSYPQDELAPVDLLLGWGPMSDSGVLEKMDFRIYNRYATWRWGGEPPLKKSEIARHAANTHIIPASDSVARQLDQIRIGSIVTIRGELVEFKSATGPERVVSSLTRDDTGPGACEVVYVTSITVR